MKELPINQIVCADALNMPLTDCSVDAIVTDPPYGLEFMGKEWDSFNAYNVPPNNKRRKKIRYIKKDGTPVYWLPPSHAPGGFKYQEKNQRERNLHFQEFSMKWLTEAYRVLKPGGSMLVMGGTRTFHRLMCAIEDSGFIIKDTLMWIYGSGFPKAQDLGKMIDKRVGKERKVIGTYQTGYNKSQKECGYRPNEYELKLTNPEPLTDLAKYWDGFKIGGIKPAYEPIVWAVKPPEGSYIDNVLKHGVGAVNVDECRIGTDIRINKGMSAKQPEGAGTFRDDNWKPRDIENVAKGRFPANIILDEESAKVMDEQSGDLSRQGAIKKKITRYRNTYPLVQNKQTEETYYGDSGGASRFFYCAKASRSERNAGLEGMEEKLLDNAISRASQRAGLEGTTGRGSLTNPMKNNHPTVKPIKLFEWLIKLVTCEGQTVLDPFLGSGTTAISAHNTGRKCIGIEKEGEYIEIAKRRTAYWESQGRQGVL